MLVQQPALGWGGGAWQGPTPGSAATLAKDPCRGLPSLNPFPLYSWLHLACWGGGHVLGE